MQQLRHARLPVLVGGVLLLQALWLLIAFGKLKSGELDKAAIDQSADVALPNNLQPQHQPSLVRFVDEYTARGLRIKERYEKFAPGNYSGSFYLIWTSSAADFDWRQRTVLHSIALHYPFARIVVVSSSELQLQVPNTKLVVLNDEFLAQLATEVPAARAWVARLDEWRTGPNYALHLKVFTRYAIAYSFGDTVGDFNTIYLRPLYKVRNAVGLSIEPECSWSSCKEQVYYTSHTLFNWEVNHPALRCMLDAFADYDPQCLECYTDSTWTRCIRTHGLGVSPLPHHFFDPIPWFEYYRYTKHSTHAPPQTVDKLLQAYALRLHDPREEIDVSSLIGHALSRFSIGIDEQVQAFVSLRQNYWLTDLASPLDGLRFLPLHIPSDETVSVVLKADAEFFLSVASPWPPVSVVQFNGTVQRVNSQLLTVCVVSVVPLVNVTVQWTTSSSSGLFSLGVRDLKRFVTVITPLEAPNTGLQVNRLSQSLLRFYPALFHFVAANFFASTKLSPAITDVIALPRDAGESMAIDKLVAAVSTPYLFYADPEYTFTFLGTNLEYLLDVIEASSFTVLGVRSPVSEQLLSRESAYSMRVAEEGLVIEPIPWFRRSSLPNSHDCYRADYFESAFIARTLDVSSLKWDSRFKQAALLTFFYRALLRGWSVGICSSAWIHREIDSHALEMVDSHQQQRWESFVRLMMREFSLRTLAFFGESRIENTGTEPLHLCALGMHGENCTECDQGFEGNDCASCTANHYGPQCLPCACVRGTCEDGRMGRGCMCDEGASGMQCDLVMTPRANVPVFCDQKAPAQAWTPIGDGFKCALDVTPDNSTGYVAQVYQSPKGAGLSYTYYALQQHPTALQVSVWSKAVVVGEGPPFGYALDIDVKYQDESTSRGLHASFNGGTHGWQLQRILIEPTKPIISLVIRLVFEEHTGLARFAHLELLEETGRLEPL